MRSTEILRVGRLIPVVLLAAVFTGHAAAQTAPVQQETKLSSPAVTASASDGGVRYTAPGEVLQIRLEIFAPTGQLVFDSGQRAGGVLAWKATDVQQGMTDGSYLSVITVRDLRGMYSQRLGGVRVQGGNLTLDRVLESELPAPQSQALNSARQARKIMSPTSDDSAVTILRDGKDRAVTVTTHNGQDGQVTSTWGSLTLRTGDIFAGKEKEQMRITPEGNVGIGTDKPEATLDVAGTIRARGGIKFEDGTVLNSAAGINVNRETNVVSSTITTAGTNMSSPEGLGTINQIAKWTGGTGTLGNSAITEVGGRVGIGGTNPTYKLVVGPDIGPGLTTSDLTVSRGPGESVSAFVGASGTHGMNFGWDQANLRAFVNAPVQSPITYTHGGVNERMRIATNGNVGIGTTTPTQRLDVAGNLKIGGAGNGLIFPDGTKLTTATGGTPSGSSIVSAVNDPGTSGVIGDNRVSLNLARLNGANAWTNSNVFGAGLSANNSLITNVGNPVNAGDAVNKAYTDANFVRFGPGAEQLSVGDANGTATMINLRGGSTCCSGPGGHTPAFFKVFQNGSFVATGNLGIGSSPMEGKGYRTSWHTYKGAFRSGYADNEWDDANVGFFSWAGGSNSTASGLYALAFGDTNFARSTSSIAFGSGNEVKGAAGFSAGAGNRVCDTYGVALGNNARSGGPYIDGKCDPETFNIRGLAAVAIGYNVTADQDHTTAMGKFASNNGFLGTFVWSDGSAQASADTFRNTANNEFAARATGGFRFRTNLGGTTGCNLPANSGVFNCTSSRTTKENFLAVDGDDVLSHLRKLPVSTWNYINEGSRVRHIGPMAEDFYTAFGLGTDNISIGVQDLAGVSLAGVKALEARTAKLQESNVQLNAALQEKNAEVEQLRSELNSLRATTDALVQRLDALEQSAQESNAASIATKSRRK